jgi:hypothetical protein
MKLLLSLFAMGSVVATPSVASAQTVESSPYGHATSETTSNVPLVATGALTAGSFYAASLASGIGLTIDAFKQCPFGGLPNCEEEGVYMLMAIPVAGPLVTVSQVDQNAGLDAAMVTMSVG